MAPTFWIFESFFKKVVSKRHSAFGRIRWITDRRPIVVEVFDFADLFPAALANSRGSKPLRRCDLRRHKRITVHLRRHTMAFRALAPILRRSTVTARTQSRALGSAPPPLPAFVRIPAPSEPVSVLPCVFSPCADGGIWNLAD